MPRMQITLTGTSTRSGSSWAVTQQWAVSSGPANALAFQTALTTAHTSLAGSTDFKTGIGTNYTMARLHGLYYPVPLGPATIVADSSGPAVVGLGTGGPVPLAIVVSERTNAAGASNRGRSYWPNGQAALDGTVAAATQTIVRASWLAAHTLVSAALTAGGWSPVHCVFSRKTGNQTPISYIQTGNRIDTARGRFGDTQEVYTSQVLPTSAQVTPGAVGLPDDADAEAIQKFEEFANSNPDAQLYGALGEIATSLALAVVAE